MTVKQLLNLYRLGQELYAETEPESLYRKSLDLLIEKTTIIRCILFRYNDREQDIECLASCNVDDASVRTARSICGELIISGKPFGAPLYSTDAMNDPRFMDLESVKMHGIKSLAVLPMIYKKLLMGMLYVDTISNENIVTESDMEFLLAYANQAALAVSNAELRDRLIRENLALKREITGNYRFSEIIGKSARMMAVFKMIGKMLNTPSSVLITGDSGTGKELIARAIHYNGDRSNYPFVAHFCGAFAENLMESELFGHVKGAFTGAVTDHTGLLESAHEGTLFLDEIAEISPAIQVKLLRFLQEGEFRPVGSSRLKKINVRIISATNRDLEKEVAEGRFREDLYYRLKVLSVHVPPLRERDDDIPLLANHFLGKYNKKIKKEIIGFAPETVELLERYEWPGNVRELENTIESAVNLADNGDRIFPEHLPHKIRTVETILKDMKISGSLKKILENVEREIMAEVLAKFNWNKSKCSTELGISRQNLIQKINKYKIRKV